MQNIRSHGQNSCLTASQHEALFPVALSSLQSCPCTPFALPLRRVDGGAVHVCHLQELIAVYNR